MKASKEIRIWHRYHKAIKKLVKQFEKEEENLDADGQYKMGNIAGECADELNLEVLKVEEHLEKHQL